MKRGLIFLAMLVSVLALGFAQNVSGTYRYSETYYITFTGNAFTGSWGNNSMSGTYTVSGNILTLNITSGTVGRNTWNWTIADANTIRDQDGDSWRKESGGSAQASSSDFVMNGTVLFRYIGYAANVTIPAGVTAIGDEAFYYSGTETEPYDHSLTSITIPLSVTSIGNYAFSNRAGLTSITIPSSVTSIENDAFTGCLASIIVDNQNSAYSSVDGVLFNKNRTVLIAYPAGKQGSYIIPSSVTSIGQGAFASSGLTSITIPSSVTTIGDGAFSYCFFLTSITIPSSVTSIGDGAFISCISLTSITIPSSVISIGDRLFQWCFSLTSVTMSRRTRIGDGFEDVRITYSD